jgi:hypothetical protein
LALESDRQRHLREGEVDVTSRALGTLVRSALDK